MGFRVRTPREALVKIQLEWNPIVDLLALQLGVDLQSRGYKHGDPDNIPYNRRPYHETGDSQYRRKNARDAIIYPTPMIMADCELIQGKTNILDETPDFALVQECDNRQSDKPAVFDVKFLKGITVTTSSSRTRKEGWSFENEFKIGGEYGGVSFENTTTVGAHGEYERMKGLEDQNTSSLETNVQIEVPAGGWYKVDQQQMNAKIEVVNLERVAFPVAFDVYCHRDLWSGRKVGDALKDNKRMRRGPWKEKHTHRMLSVNGVDDLYNLLVGVHSDYPNQRRNLLDSNSVIRRCWEILSDKDKWSIEAERRIPFDKAQHGVCRIINMQPGVGEEMLVDPRTVLRNPADVEVLESQGE